MQVRAGRAGLPAPGVSEPERRQNVQLSRLGRPVGDRETNEQVVDASFRVLHDDVEVTVAVEDAGVEQLVLRPVPIPTRRLLVQTPIGVRALRVLVEVLHVRVRRGVVEVEVALLHVLAVIALDAGDAEEAFLEDRIAAVPERPGEAEALMVVRDAGEAVLPPPVGTRARLIVRKILPRRAGGAVVLAHRPPLSLRQVGSPASPVHGAVRRLLEPPMLLGHPRFGYSSGNSGGIRCSTTRLPGCSGSCRPCSRWRW